MLKLNIGLSKKVGEPNYGSRGASVNLELEVEAGLVNQPDELQDRIRRLFRLAKSSVDDELNGSTNNGQNGNVHDSNGNGQQQRGGRAATASQVRALHSIASRQRLDLAAEVRNRFNIDRPEDLLIGEASELIDAIKPHTNGNGGQR
jgi:hypothetical protein